MIGELKKKLTFFKRGGTSQKKVRLLASPSELLTTDDAVAHRFDDLLVGYAEPYAPTLAGLDWDPLFIDHFGESSLSGLGAYQGINNDLHTPSFCGDTKSRFSHNVMQSPAAVAESQPRESFGATRSKGEAGTDDGVWNWVEATDLICPHPDCTYKKPFSGPWELKRHIKGKHLGMKTFACPAVGCFKKRERTAFARLDKLTSHFRSTHDPDTIVECPHEACKAAGLVSHCDLVAVHLELHHGLTTKSKSKTVSDVLREASTERKCPLWHCKVRLGPWQLLGHINEHSWLEIQPQIDDIRAQNFSVVRMDGFSQMSGQPNPTIGLRMICPVCQATYNHCIGLFRHFFDMHLTEGMCPSVRSLGANSANVGYQEAYTMLMRIVNGDIRIDLSDLIPFRRQLLRLIPQCATDPRWRSMWKNITWKHDRSMYSSA